MPEEAIGAAIEAKVCPLVAGAVGFPRIVGAAILGGLDPPLGYGPPRPELAVGDRGGIDLPGGIIRGRKLRCQRIPRGEWQRGPRLRPEADTPRAITKGDSPEAEAPRAAKGEAGTAFVEAKR